MIKFNIQKGAFTLRSCDDDIMQMAEIVYESPDGEHQIAVFKSVKSQELVLDIDYDISFEQQENFDIEILTKMINLLYSITEKLLLSENEYLHFVKPDEPKDPYDNYDE